MEIRIAFFTQYWLKDVNVVESILDLFDNVSIFAPTHWQRDDNPSTTCPYNKQDFLDSLTLAGDYSSRSLLRKKKSNEESGYTFDMTIYDDQLNYFWLVFKGKFKQGYLAQIFELADALATHLEIELGCIEFADNQEHSQPYMQWATIRPMDLQNCGLGAVGIRTWYGAHLTSLIGKERLLFCGIPIQETDWGGVKLDLVENPWNADWDTLLEAQQKVMECLIPSGVFGDYKRTFFYKAGPNWVPIPISIRRKGEN